ncbi:hypothetical protein ZIOFF_014182 [Zingiber officinale]|uniref:Uncharacterized protein n=1 Tax=Zingiber officinale TaxID=94328 RepID=A0A8J5HGZ0_ZINOF|nr:hypothetical protein ZIOFF_014182 [Zingiber officinale]
MVLVLELGVCIIPLTLVLVPCRRLVRLVAELQRLRLSVARSGYLSPAAWPGLIRDLQRSWAKLIVAAITEKKTTKSIDL